MPGEAILSDLQDFVRFATTRIERGKSGESIEDLVREWRNDSEFAETVADVRQGFVDHAAGRAESVESVFADIRRQLGIAE